MAPRESLPWWQLFSPADLPIAVIVLAIGFHTEAARIGAVLKDRQTRAAFCATLLTTLLIVPLIAISAVWIVPHVPPEGVIGILTVALLPGGPLANILAVAVGANSELNVTLTVAEMILSTALLPLGLLVVMPRVLGAEQVIRVPFSEMVHGIALVLGPMLTGVAASSLTRLEGLTAARRRVVKRRIFRLLLLLALLLAIAVWRLHTSGPPPLSAQLTELLRSAELPPDATLLAAPLFGVATVAWCCLLGWTMPAQPTPNRISICLEVGTRDLTIALVIALVGLPSLPAPQRAQVALAVLLAWATCNGGVALSGFLMCALSGPVCYADAGGGDGGGGGGARGADCEREEQEGEPDKLALRTSLLEGSGRKSDAEDGAGPTGATLV